MNRASWGDRIRYAFDNTMSKGTIALIGWLAVLSVAFIAVVAALVALFGIAPGDGDRLDFLEAAWLSLMRTLDAGTMGGDEGWPFRLAMLVVTFGGIFVISTLIGVLSNGIDEKLQDLRKGRSRVIESGHTLILGWSRQIFTIIQELAQANANQRNPCIVVLGSEDKVSMEDAIRDRAGDPDKMRIVCRTGDPLEADDLDLVSIHTARSIIILSPETDDPDAHVVKTLLAITNNPRRRPEPYHIVAEVRDPQNIEVARMAGRGEAELVLSGSLISRIMAQTCRQTGLSTVYTELLGFGGDEIYFASEPALTGKTFGEALLAYEDSAVIGVCPRNGRPMLNPSMDTRLEEGDRIIAISRDDDTIRLSGKVDLGITLNAICDTVSRLPAPERTLMLGWNWRAPLIIRELDQYVADGSSVTVVADEATHQTEIAACCSSITHLTIDYRAGNTTDRRTLDALRVEQFNHVILLCSNTVNAQEADARALMTLLHLRDIAERCGHTFSIVSEMRDPRDRNLAEVARADDFIVSDHLVSLLMAQISENKQLGAVFDDLFAPEGSEIYIKPAGHYVALDEPVNFYTVVESARRKGEAAIGYRLRANANGATLAHGVVINPAKSAEITFGARDRIIVLAES